MTNIKIDDLEIGNEKPVFIIAEAGVNHNGSLDMAKQLIDVAVEAKVDAIKFQTFKSQNLVSRLAPKAEYQKHTTNILETQLEMLQRLELSPHEHYQIKNYCQKQGIIFISTAFDQESAKLLNDLDIPAFKISSCDITNWPLLKYIASQGKPILLSTGMSYLSEVDEAVRLINDSGCHQLGLLHCVSNYPTDPVDVNLKAIQTLKTVFQLPTGYSDHTTGIEVALGAVALGANIIEKHFTLDKNLSGPDHKASLNPNELKNLVLGIRMVEKAMGNGEKKPSLSEISNSFIVRRSIAAACNISAGTAITNDMLTTLRPGSGIPPKYTEIVVGRKVKYSVKIGELILWSNLE